MSTKKKTITKLVVKTTYSLVIVAGVLTLMLLILSFYNETGRTTNVEKTASQHIDFPENQDMLNSMSDKLAKEGASLSDIAPAAGDDSLDSALAIDEETSRQLAQ